MHQQRGLRGRRRRRSVRSLSVVAVTAVGTAMALSACGSSRSSAAATPGQAVTDAVAALGSQSSVGVRLSLPITASQAQQLGAQSGSKVTSADAQALTSGSLFFDEASGHGEAVDSSQFQTDSADSFDLGVTIGGNTPLELRYVAQNLYVRADASQLLSDVGQPTSKAAAFQNAMSKAELYVPGLSSLGTSKWVEASHASLESLAPILKGLEAQSQQSGSPSPTQLKALMANFRQALLSSLESSSTFASQGSGYVMTTNVHNLLASIAPAVKADIGVIPQEGPRISDLVNSAVTKIPSNRTAVVDLSVSGGRLSQAQVDLNQFATHKMTFAVPLRFAFTTPGTVSAPSTQSTTVLDLSKLPSLLQQMLSGGLLGGGSTGTGQA